MATSADFFTSYKHHDPDTAATAAVATIAAAAGERWVIDTITASYDGASTAGTLTVTDGGTTIWKTHCINAASNSWHFPFDEGLTGSYNSAVVVTLAAETGLKGIVSVTYH